MIDNSDKRMNGLQMCFSQSLKGSSLMIFVEEKMGATAVDENDALLLAF